MSNLFYFKSLNRELVPENKRLFAEFLEKNDKMNKKQQIKRYLFLKQELEKSMPSVIIALGMGFYPANYKMLETIAQEFSSLEKELNL